MKELIEKLADKMSELEGAALILADLKKDFERRYQADADRVESLKKEIADLKKAIEPLAIAEHRETGSKKLYGGIGIQDKKAITYDVDKAREWAEKKGLFLTLDKKAFDKAAESLNLDFVKIDKEVKKVTFPKKFTL